MSLSELEIYPRTEHPNFTKDMKNKLLAISV